MKVHGDRVLLAHALPRHGHEEHVAVASKLEWLSFLDDAVDLHRHLKIDLHLPRGVQHLVRDGVAAADAAVVGTDRDVKVVELSVPPRSTRSVRTAKRVGSGECSWRFS